MPAQNNIRHQEVHGGILDSLLERPTAEELDLTRPARQNDPYTALGHQGERIKRHLEIPIHKPDPVLPGKGPMLYFKGWKKNSRYIFSFHPDLEPHLEFVINPKVQTKGQNAQR